MHPTALLTSIQLSLNTFTFGKVKQQKQRNKTKTKIALSRIFFFFGVCVLHRRVISKALFYILYLLHLQFIFAYWLGF